MSNCTFFWPDSKAEHQLLNLSPLVSAPIKQPNFSWCSWNNSSISLFISLFFWKIIANFFSWLLPDVWRDKNFFRINIQSIFRSKTDGLGVFKYNLVVIKYMTFHVTSWSEDYPTSPQGAQWEGLSDCWSITATKWTPPFKFVFIFSEIDRLQEAQTLPSSFFPSLVFLNNH